MEAADNRTEHSFIEPPRGVGRRPIFFVSGDCASWLMAQKMGSDWGQIQIFIACRRGSCGRESAFVTLLRETYSCVVGGGQRPNGEANLMSNAI